MTVYLDSNFDVAAVSELAHRERSAFKPIYRMNKWWARRSSSEFRAILLGLQLPPGADLLSEFYTNRQERNPKLQKCVVLDPFMGGGTTIVEALRMGYKVVGVDLNPLAWFIVKTETTRVDIGALQQAFDRVKSEVAPVMSSIYATRCVCCGEAAEIVHAFWVKVAPCTNPSCECQVPLFRNYIIGKRRGTVSISYKKSKCPHCDKTFDLELTKATLTHNGPVQSDDDSSLYWDGNAPIRCPYCQGLIEPPLPQDKLSVKKVSLRALLCPNCWTVFSYRGPVPHQVECPNCHLPFDPHKGVTDRGTYICPNGHESRIVDAANMRPEGKPLSFRLYAIEGYCPHCAEKRVRSGPTTSLGQAHLEELARPAPCPSCQATVHRFYKQPDTQDLKTYQESVEEWDATKEELPWPRVAIQDYEKTNRLVIHNYRYWHQLFNPRQLLALTTILKTILAEPEQQLKEALLAAFLGTLEHHNMLNIYYVPYAQSAGAFGRHDFHPKVTVCEGNPWGGTKGRGTFLRSFEAVREGKEYLTNPYDAQYTNGKRKKVYTGEEFAGRPVRNFTGLTGDEGNLLLRVQDARDLSFIPDEVIDHVVTDPPYADSVQYSELADFFYVWLREALADDYPELLKASETPKASELVENKQRGKTQADFHEGLLSVFRECHRVLEPNGRLVFTFHHSRRSQWSDLLRVLLEAGFIIERTYPVHSEGTTSGNLVFHSNPNSIAYDIIHVCRKAHEPDDRAKREVGWNELKSQIHNDVSTHIDTIRQGSHGQRITQPDLEAMAWGECLETFSKHYGYVSDEDGQPVGISQALEDVSHLVQDMLD